MWYRCTGRIVVLFLGFGFGQSLAEDAELKPADEYRAITRTVLENIQKQHLLNKAFDRRMANQALDSYLELIDPQKQYFLQSDIAEFNRRKVDLADELKEGDISIAFDIYRRYQQRMREA